MKPLKSHEHPHEVLFFEFLTLASYLKRIELLVAQYGSEADAASASGKGEPNRSVRSLLATRPLFIACRTNTSQHSTGLCPPTLYHIHYLPYMSY